jgi:hypothetical protein
MLISTHCSRRECATDAGIYLRASSMQTERPKNSIPNTSYRCSGPNCGQIKNAQDRWWMMWTSFAEYNRPVLYLCAWDEEIAQRESTLHVCGELCAQRLQSQFMGNVREPRKQLV